jgi:hypothetical protein
MNRAYTSSGYAYRLQEGDWLHSTDDDWEVVIVGELIGTIVGQREIDGAGCTVVQVEDEVYAQLRTHVRAA